MGAHDHAREDVPEGRVGRTTQGGGTNSEGEEDQGVSTNRGMSRMDRLTRRRFLRNTSVGAAAVGLLPAASGLVAAEQSPAASEVAQEAPALTENLVALIHTAAQGELTLFVGTREIVVRDTELIARLARAVS